VLLVPVQTLTELLYFFTGHIIISTMRGGRLQIRKVFAIISKLIVCLALYFIYKQLGVFVWTKKIIRRHSDLLLTFSEHLQSKLRLKVFFC
jgi:hypothetical protein